MAFTRDGVVLDDIGTVDGVLKASLGKIDGVEVPSSSVVEVVDHVAYNGRVTALTIAARAGLEGDVRVIWCNIKGNRYPNFTTTDYQEVWRTQARSMGIAIMIHPALASDGNFPAVDMHAGDNSLQYMIAQSTILRGVDPTKLFPSYNLGGTNTPATAANFVAGPSDFTNNFLAMGFMTMDDSRPLDYSTLSGDFDENYLFWRAGGTSLGVISAVHFMDNNLAAGQNSGVTNFTLSDNDGVATCSIGWQAK